AKEDGVPVDNEALQARVRQAVIDIVAKQRECGVAIVNDGEMSKPSYATYIKDRLHGFGGSENRYVFADLVDFPNLARRIGEDPSRQHRHAPGCKGPISVKDLEGPKEDVTNLKNAVNGA